MEGKAGPETSPVFYMCPAGRNDLIVIKTSVRLIWTSSFPFVELLDDFLKNDIIRSQWLTISDQFIEAVSDDRRSCGPIRPSPEDVRLLGDIEVGDPARADELKHEAEMVGVEMGLGKWVSFKETW